MGIRWSKVVGTIVAPSVWLAIAPMGERLAAQLASDEQLPSAPLASLQERESLSEQRRDALESMALFAAGRMLEHRDDLAGALRYYQRAFRRNQAAVEPLARAVELAFRTRQGDVALRYAVQLADTSRATVEQVERLADFFEQTGDHGLTARMKQRLVELTGSNLDPRGKALFLFDIGRNQWLSGQSREAAATLQEAYALLESQGEDRSLCSQVAARWGLREADLLVALGRVFLDGDLPLVAEKVFREAHAMDPGSPLDLHLALVSRVCGDWESSLSRLEAYFDAVQAASVPAPEACCLWIEAWGNAGRSGDPLARLLRLRSATQGNAYLDVVAARQHFRNAESDQMVKALAEAGRRIPELAPAARLASRGGTRIFLEPLLDLAEQVVAEGLPLASPAGPTPRVDRPELVEALGSMWLEPGSNERIGGPFGRREVALACLVSGKTTLAHELLDRELAELSPDDQRQLLLSWGVRLIGQRQYASAVDALRTAIDRGLAQDREPLFHYYLATAYGMEDRTGEALAAIGEALAREPDSCRLQARKAWIHYRAGNAEEAIHLYEELIRQHDARHELEEHRIELRDARLALSHLHARKGDLPTAEELLEQVLDEFPDDVGALNDLAFLWVDQGKHLLRSLAMIERALAQDPHNAAYLDSLGWAYFRLGRYAEAAERLRQAAATSDPDPVILDHLGEALVKLGQRQEACSVWRMALEHCDPRENAREAEAIRAKLGCADPAAVPGEPAGSTEPAGTGTSAAGKESTVMVVEKPPVLP